MRKLISVLLLLFVIGGCCFSSSATSAKVSISFEKRADETLHPAIVINSFGQSGLDEVRPCSLIIYPETSQSQMIAPIIDCFSYDISFCIYDKNQIQVIDLPKMRDLSFDFLDRETNKTVETKSIGFTQTAGQASFSIEADEGDIKSIIEMLMDKDIITVLSFEYSKTFFAVVFTIDDNSSLEMALEMVKAFEDRKTK